MSRTAAIFSETNKNRLEGVSRDLQFEVGKVSGVSEENHENNFSSSIVQRDIREK